MKLQNKILLLLLPLLALPVLVLGGVAYQRLLATAEQALLGQMRTVLDQAAARARAFEQTSAANVALFAQSALLKQYLLTPEADRYALLQLPLLREFAGYRSAYPAYYELRVLRPDGREEARSAVKTLANASESDADRDYFQALIQGADPEFQRYLRNPDDGNPVLLTAKPLRFEQPALVELASAAPPLQGFLVITERLEALRDQLEQSRFGGGGRMWAADRQGNLLWGTLHGRVRLPAALRELADGQLRTLTNDRGEAFRYQTRILPSGLRLIVRVPRTELVAESHRVGWLALGLLAAVALLTVGLVMLGLRHLLLNRLQCLEETARAWGQGALDQRVPAGGGDELDGLIQRLNGMAGDLAAARARQEQTQQEALRHQEQAIDHLRQADRLKDEFLANTSHELRTPLHGIIGIGQSLLDGVGGQLSELQRQNLEMIVHSGQRLSGLVNDILDAYQMRRHELRLHCQPVDLRGVAQLVLELARPLAKDRPLELRNEVPPRLPPVHGDENRLQQILLNLVGNAIKFTPQGQIAVSADVEGDFARVWVRDTGIGIEEEHQTRIFEAFAQADGSTTREHGGTGLGLSVTRQLVELHGGAISVASCPDQGSVFTFTLPLSTESLPESAHPVPPPTDMTPAPRVVVAAEPDPSLCDLHGMSGECKILLVDDEPVNLQVLVNFLSRQGYDLTLAASGAETLHILESGYEPDLIVLDVMMPKMTGYEVTQLLRETWGIDELPILLLTAKNRVEDVIIGLEAGANDYLTKPVAKEELLARIRTHLTVKRLKHAREMAVENARLKSEFLANMSHEIRTPMNAVIGMTDLLGGTPLSEEQRDYVTTIRTGSETLLGLINDILDFSKIEAGKLELEQQPFDLRVCIEEALDLVAANAAKKGLNLAYRIAPGTPELPTGDITRLRQTLVNLLGNAVKFTHHGGIEVAVHAHSIPPPEMPDREDLPWYEFEFSVRDSGIGISPEQQEKLFQSFSQLDASTTRHYGGTGLGLAICKRLTELMGGQIRVESEPGQGATFFFTIREQAQLFNPEQRIWQGEKPYFLHRRMLIAVDAAVNRELLESLGQSWGLDTRSLDCAASALDIPLESQGYDVGVLELSAADQVDVAMLERIRDFRQHTQFPLIVLTPMCRERHFGALFNHCLGKPIKPAKLFQILRGMFDRAPTQAPSATPEASETARAELRILLAEDNPVNQKVASVMLQKLGYQADIANNGLEVLAALRETAYDLIFMDVQMPEMDGLTATRRIRGEWPGDRQPWIVAMTANAMEGDRETCLLAGMNDYVSKPIRPDGVRQALSGYRPLAERG